jgi:nitrite reductase/ring-hydroxylating ferredoxin subunit
VSAATRRLVPVVDCAQVPPGSTTVVEVEGRPLLIAATEDGWWAADAFCPHAGAPLEEAALSGCLLVCPWHEAVLDARTGAALRGPARRALRTYPTSIQAGTVLVELEER